jgi:hypothetical protein
MKKCVRDLQVDHNYFPGFVSLIVMASLFLLPLNLHGQGGKANFSGTWSFNESKSNMGEGRGFGRAGQMTVTQTGNNLSVDRVRTNQNGDKITTNEKYTLDGKESVNDSGRGGASKAIVSWSADGKSLNFAVTRSFERNGEKTEFKSTEVWSLTDPKTLSVATTSNFQGNERKATLVYDKQ